MSILRPADLGIGQLFEAIHDGVVVVDVDSDHIVMWNPAAQRIFGYSAAETLGRPITILLPEGSPARSQTGLARQLLAGSGVGAGSGTPVELPARRQSGEEIAVELTLSSVTSQVVPGHFALALVRDVTERKRLETERFQLARVEAARAEAELARERAEHDLEQLRQTERRLARIKRLYAVLSEINETIVRVRDQERLFAEACRVVVEHGEFRMAWLGLVDPETLAVRPVAWAGAEEGLLRAVRVTATDEPEGLGPTGRAIRTGRPVIVNDVVHDPEVAPWREELLRRGFRATGSFPLRTGDRTIGVLTIQSEEAHFYDAEETAVLERLAADLSFALEVMGQDEELRFQRALLEAQGEASIDGICVTSPDGRVLSYNRRFVELWNIPETILGERTRDSLMRAVAERLADSRAVLAHSAYLLSHPDAEGHDEAVLSDGRVFERYSAPVRSSSGRYFGRVWYWRDVTERRRAEEALRVSEARLQAILDNSTAVIYLKDPAGRFLLVNRQFEHIFQVTRDQMRGQTDHAIFSKEAADAYRANDLEVLRSGQALEIEETATLEDGLHTYISVKFPLYDESGAIYAVCGISTDITERKRAEQERGRLLEQEQQLRREAEAAARLREEFLSIAAHELKTPLTSVRGFAQILTRQLEAGQIEDDRVRLAATAIDRQSAKLADLIGQLLDVTRLDAGRLTLSRTNVDLVKLMHGLVSVAQMSAPQTLIVRAPAAVTAWVDSLRLEQVITNLLVNATKYSPEESEIEVEIARPRVEQVTIAVRDYGIGIPEEHRAHIFDRFYRAHADSHQSGLGLGLYISAHIVELHGGCILVESPPDGGTRFVVTLPLDPDHSSPLASESGPTLRRRQL